MPQITVKFDSKLKKPEIIIPLTNGSKEQLKDTYSGNKQQLQQTSIYGIQAPLIMINNVAIDFTDVVRFQLKSTGPTPQTYMEVKDRYNLISSISTPGLDNEIVVQILPPFDNAYKKINLVFSISNISISGSVIKLSGVYKIPKLISSNIKSFGEIGSYELFEYIAKETELGFASNCENNQSDKRYIYCDNISYNELMDREIKHSPSDANHIYTYWIDFWDCINYVNIYERYNSTDKDEDMMIWVAAQPNEFEEGVDIKPQQIKSIISNHPMMGNSELFSKKMEIVNNTGAYISDGTDKLYSIYEENRKEYMDHLIQDGDVKKDIFTKYSYLGENYGEYNYLLAEVCRNSYLQKMNTETIKVTINSPLLAMMRGHKTDVMWYINDDNWKSRIKEFEDNDIINKYEQINLVEGSSNSGNKTEYNNLNGEFILDKSTSGQYTIIGCTMNYYMGMWYYELLLCRPNINKPAIFKNNI